MVWFSLGVFLGQIEELLLPSHLAKSHRSGDLKIEFLSSVYIFRCCCLANCLWPSLRASLVKKSPAADCNKVIGQFPVHTSPLWHACIRVGLYRKMQEAIFHNIFLYFSFYSHVYKVGQCSSLFTHYPIPQYPVTLCYLASILQSIAWIIFIFINWKR